MCKNLTLRLKRTGVQWNADTAAGIMDLVALCASNPRDVYWTSRQAANRVEKNWPHSGPRMRSEAA